MVVFSRLGVVGETCGDWEDPGNILFSQIFMSYTDGLKACIQWAVTVQFQVLFCYERFRIRNAELLRCFLHKVYLISLVVLRQCPLWYVCLYAFLCVHMLCECGVWAREGCQVSLSHSLPYSLATGLSLSETRARLAASKLKWPFCPCSHIAPGPQASIHSCPAPFWVLGFELRY